MMEVKPPEQSIADAELMRAEFWAWVDEQGCDTDGAWSAWQGAWDFRAPDWNTVQRDGFPPLDGHTTYIGINSAGYACCFNAMQGGTCVMTTAEGAYPQMSDLRDWRLLDRPVRRPE
jgi:hypothetical protein